MVTTPQRFLKYIPKDKQGRSLEIKLRNPIKVGPNTNPNRVKCCQFFSFLGLYIIISIILQLQELSQYTKTIEICFSVNKICTCFGKCLYKLLL